MQNEIIKAAPVSPALPNQNGMSLQQNAEKVYNIGKVERAGDITTNIQVNIMGSGLPGMPGYIPPKSQSLNLEKYHFIVIYGEEFSGGYCLMDKKRSLTEESTSEELRNKYVCMTDEVIEELKHYPAIFMAETDKAKIAAGEQYAYWGIITDIKRLTKDIQIHYQLLSYIPVTALFDITRDLDILGAPFFGEMNHTHWALKEVNCLEVFRKAGINVLAPIM